MTTNLRMIFISTIHKCIKFIQEKMFWNKISKYLNPFYYILKFYFLKEIIKKSRLKSDISDHLITLFLESVHLDPKLIVELGVRGGESTFVLERVAKLYGIKLVSVDIEECSKTSLYHDWIFVNKDDIKFGKEFKNWCERLRIIPRINILFIDTSHIFEHTIQEINTWFPFLSDKAKVFFHDTNIKEKYYRKDGSVGRGWDNERGVMKALENYFNKHFNEEINFIYSNNNWLIKNYSYCNGFTILEKLGGS